MEKIKGLFFILMVILAWIAFHSWKEEEGAKERLAQEANLIEEFLEGVEVIREDSAEFQKESVQKETVITEETLVENWSDDAWFMQDGVMFTPEFARGTLDCVLEMENIRLRRGVYTGTEEEIHHNLDVWMLTTARSDYCLGETHYCIYGHNCVGSGQEISLNRLQEIAVGDCFTLTTKNREMLYRVTSVYGLGREEVTRRLVDNFSLPSDRCYIITCGRGEYRYLDFVVEGHLVNG